MQYLRQRRCRVSALGGNAIMPQLLDTLHQGIRNVLHTADAESGVSEAPVMQQQKVP
jgi:hypothetical protein